MFVMCSARHIRLAQAALCKPDVPREAFEADAEPALGEIHKETHPCRQRDLNRQRAKREKEERRLLDERPSPEPAAGDTE